MNEESFIFIAILFEQSPVVNRKRLLTIILKKIKIKIIKRECTDNRNIKESERGYVKKICQSKAISKAHNRSDTGRYSSVGVVIC